MEKFLKSMNCYLKSFRRRQKLLKKEQLFGRQKGKKIVTSGVVTAAFNEGDDKTTDNTKSPQKEGKKKVVIER